MHNCTSIRKSTAWIRNPEANDQDILRVQPESNVKEVINQLSANFRGRREGRINTSLAAFSGGKW